MNTQHSNDMSQSKPDQEKKHDAAPSTPGKDSTRDFNEKGSSREGGQNADKGSSNKGRDSTGTR